MDISIKTYTNFVKSASSTFSPIQLEKESEDYSLVLRAFSLSRNIWIKDTTSLKEVVDLLCKEGLLSAEAKLVYPSMLRDAATLLAHKIVFTEEAKTVEVRKRKLTYDMSDILGLKKGKFIPGDSKPNILEGLKEDGGPLKPAEKVQVELNRVIYQSVITKTPAQVATILYNEVKDCFVYRLYRVVDCSVFEITLSSKDVKLGCAPSFETMMKNKMHY